MVTPRGLIGQQQAVFLYCVDLLSVTKPAPEQVSSISYHGDVVYRGKQFTTMAVTTENPGLNLTLPLN